MTLPLCKDYRAATALSIDAWAFLVKTCRHIAFLPESHNFDPSSARSNHYHISCLLYSTPQCSIDDFEQLLRIFYEKLRIEYRRARRHTKVTPSTCLVGLSGALALAEMHVC